jgi:DNA polymerase
MDRETREELQSIALDLVRHARWAESRGEREFPLPGPVLEPAPSAPARPTPAVPAAPTVPATAAARADSAAPSAPEGALEALRREIGDCTRCKLCRGRKNLVFGTGNPRARLVFVGEGPGAEEDLQGLPFVGAAGELLTRMIEAMGLSRQEVYICNVIKCRPPGNRNPEPDEIEACSPFLRRQLEAIRPEVIVTLGKFAAQTLLRTTEPIGRLRGNWHRYEGIDLLPTFHPAYLLRSPHEKRKAWADLQLVMKRLGLEAPAEKKRAARPLRGYDG